MTTIQYAEIDQQIEKLKSRNLTFKNIGYAKKFPQDTIYLEQILNLKITLHDIVWITDKSKIYHTLQHCSGMKKAQEIDLEKAKGLGYVKCRKCCQ